MLALAQAGCGDSESPESGVQLSKGQFQQIERLYRVQLATEQMEDAGESRRALKKIARACAAVDDSDPLLAAVVNGCGEMTRFGVSLADSECDSASACEKTLSAAAAKTEELIDTMRQNERTIDDLLGDSRCSQALDTPQEIFAAFETLRRAFREMAAAMESGDDALMSEATATLAQGEKDLDSAPSATALLDRFREACA